MSDNNTSKMCRQLRLYSYIRNTVYHGPSELMEHFGITRRMLQRDLKDLRDSGLINVKYQKVPDDNYVCAEEPPVFDETATGRHRQHLIRLHRLVTILDKLPRTDMEELEQYERDYDEYVWYRDNSAENPEEFPIEDIPDLPVLPEFADIKSIYYNLFPDSNERTRQRDFKALSDAGFPIYYIRRYKAFLFEG